MIRILSYLSPQNTAGVEAVYCQDGAVFTVAKLVRPGNLLKAVTNLQLKGKLFCEAHVASIMKDIIAGLGHIHGYVSLGGPIAASGKLVPVLVAQSRARRKRNWRILGLREREWEISS